MAILRETNWTKVKRIEWAENSHAHSFTQLTPQSSHQAPGPAADRALHQESKDLSWKPEPKLSQPFPFFGPQFSHLWRGGGNIPASHHPMDPMGVQLEGVCDEAPGCCFQFWWEVHPCLQDEEAASLKGKERKMEISWHQGSHCEQAGMQCYEVSLVLARMGLRCLGVTWTPLASSLPTSICHQVLVTRSL